MVVVVWLIPYWADIHKVQFGSFAKKEGNLVVSQLFRKGKKLLLVSFWQIVVFLVYVKAFAFDAAVTRNVIKSNLA